jgi:hypothetical protein
LAEKSSEKTTVEIWAEAFGEHIRRTAAIQSMEARRAFKTDRAMESARLCQTVNREGESGEK